MFHVASRNKNLTDWTTTLFQLKGEGEPLAAAHDLRMCRLQHITNELLETGDTRFKDETRLWIAKAFPKRTDNLVCAAVVLEDQLVVKTLMHHFDWEAMP